MIISVNGGHTPTSAGASGYLDEVREDRIIKDCLIAELRARGHEVSDSTADDWMGYPQELNTQCQRANASDAELGVSIHLNAGGGTGVEVLHYPGTCEGLSADVSARLAAVLGLPDRGAKARSDLGWLNGTNMPAVLVEVCFVDSSADKEAYDAVSYQAIACAIADGLVGGGQAAPIAPPAPPASSGEVPAIYLQAKLADGTVLPATTWPDYAGWGGVPIAYLAAWCEWPLEVQAYTANGWLNSLTNPDDIENLGSGCVGDGTPMMGLKMYLTSPDSRHVVAYQVTIDGNCGYPEQRDHETSDGQDGYAGDLVTAITEVKARIEAY
ncbi:N-acetylmuramoyl-L-alanine amidase [Gordonibacter sp.]|uniref:N-acetylmuramoyl-L-alanine amidase n=1 Tax=Gordonibacter sp. TaxID=1968902 RepID=UPI002FCBC1F2